VLAPEVRDMHIDDALEEVWDTVPSRRRIEHGSAEFQSRVCSADIKAPEQMR
jgi:hypothetical protein